MSTCISKHGEFGSHEADDEFTCRLCGAFDESGALERIKRLERGIREARENGAAEFRARMEALADCWDSEASGLGPSLSELMLRDSARQLRAALAEPAAEEGKDGLRARIEALCVDLERSSHGGNWIRGDERRGCVAEFRAVLAEPAAEEHP